MSRLITPSNISSPTTSGLNQKQFDAVTLPLSNALILAGAGSGKTRVLVHRIAYLISHYGLSPYSILAVTFTNKAAAEMRSRIENIIQQPSQGLWIGTFHGIAHRLLRIHWQEAGLIETFQVIDSDDQLRLIKRIMKDLNLDDKQISSKNIQGFINHQKDQGIRASYFNQTNHSKNSAYPPELIQAYLNYEQLCHQNSLVDFAELLLRAYELWTKNKNLLTHYQSRFKALLVDEFQDTNQIQYLWLKALSHNTDTPLPILVVGDDDQSIYGWRGAQVGNLAAFQKDFAPVQLIRLEENYRSTPTILNAANSLISNNTQRLGKNLFTNNQPENSNPSNPSNHHSNQTHLINLYTAFNELEEAYFIAHQIQQAQAAGHLLKNIAILYRSNAQSRVLEEALLLAHIPYKVYGGMRFFERAEIKTALAYCRLVYSRDDDSAFERIINTPTRSIGEKTQSDIREQAKNNHISLWSAALNLIQTKALPARADSALQNFINLINQLSQATQNPQKNTQQDLPLYEQIDLIIKQSGLIPFYQKEELSKAESRLENLGELITAARTFIPENFKPINPESNPENIETELSPMAAFLSHAVLESNDTQADQYQDAVQLMTIHSSKGLEFPWVFITGLEENLFPSPGAINDLQKLEEERRLMYVGITRAMQKLTLTHSESRRVYGETTRHFPSRFLREIPKELILTIRHKNHTAPYQAHSSSYSSSYSSAYSNSKPPIAQNFNKNNPPPSLFSKPASTSHKNHLFEIGQSVQHETFGLGVILNSQGTGDRLQLQIHFDQGGSKWLTPLKLKPI